MTDLKQEIFSSIKKKREKLRDSSIQTYTSNLSSLYRRMDGNDGLKFFSRKKEILEHIKAEPSNKRKTLLSALFILTGIPEYREIMIQDCHAVNSQYKMQKMSATQKENWISMEEIQVKYAEYFNKVTQMFKGKELMNSKVITEFFLLALMSGVAGLPPRRSEDYGEMKIRNFDVNKDNYYEKDKFVFQKYKTAKVYGRVMFDVKKMAPHLNVLIKKWVSVNKTDYLLFSSNGKPLSSSQIAHHNNAIWGGKKVSTNIYRHVFLTDFYKRHGMVSLMDMENLSRMMSHSVMTAMEYIKRDAPADVGEKED